MKQIVWNLVKSDALKNSRGVSFEEISQYLELGHVIDVMDHPNQLKYPGQRMFVLQINGYIYLVPFVENEDVIFLKTIIPSRKATKKYLGER